jgi:general secretion pathway protein N
MVDGRIDMLNWPKILGVALLTVGMLLFGPAPLLAATSATSDILSDRPGEATDTVDIGSVKPLTQPSREAVAKPVPVGNPLWSVPLSVLTATQERPIFLASRRPPQRAVAAPPREEVSVPVVQKEPEQLPLALIGSVVGDNDSIAVFLDRTNQKIVRLRQGEAHAGWVLASVQGREVTLKKADRTETLALKGPDAQPGSAVPPMPTMPTMPTMPMMVGGGAGYAPFIPRSTPKNGESDGL